MKSQHEEEAEALERAIVDWGIALRARYPTCGLGPLECGGTCHLPLGHDPPCLCAGDEDGPGTCPA